MILTEIVFIK